MKTRVMALVLILVHAGLCFGQEQVEVSLSRFIYSIPVIEGMQPQGNSEQEMLPVGSGNDFGIITKVFHSKEGSSISAAEISRFYYDHFT